MFCFPEAVPQDEVLGKYTIKLVNYDADSNRFLYIVTYGVTSNEVQCKSKGVC